MPYKDPKKTIDNNRKNRRRWRRDPAYRIAERQRDRETKRKRRATESAEKIEERLAKARIKDRARYVANPSRRAQQRDAARRWLNVPANRIQANQWRRCSPLGITQSDIDALKLKQDCRCAICRKDLPPIGAEPGRNLEHIDHDHETGRVRGILCGGCNTALGRFGDNADGVRRALAYLELQDGPIEPDWF